MRKFKKQLLRLFCLHRLHLRVAIEESEPDGVLERCIDCGDVFFTEDELSRP